MDIFAINQSDQNQSNWTLSGWDEVILFVDQSSRIVDFLTEVGGWRLICTHQLHHSVIDFWALPEDVHGHEHLLHTSDHADRVLRVVQFNLTQVHATRAHCQPWDSGGIFDLNLRVHDLSSYIPRLRQWGWQAVCPPFQFSFGEFEVKEWIIKDPCGITLALIERLTPPLHPPLSQTLGTAFNSTQVVRDFEVAYSFYKDILGFKTYLSHRGSSKGLGQNVFGLPKEIALKIERQVEVMHPQGLNMGSIELLSFEGLSGEDVSALGTPPHLGVNILRFPTQNLSSFAQYIGSVYQSDLISKIHSIRCPLKGQIDLLSVYTPDGVRLEFYET